MHVVTLNFVFNHDDNERDINHNPLDTISCRLAVRRLIRLKKRSKWQMIVLRQRRFLWCISQYYHYIRIFALCNIETYSILWLKFNFNFDFLLKGKTFVFSVQITSCWRMSFMKIFIHLTKRHILHHIYIENFKKDAEQNAQNISNIGWSNW